MIVGCYSVDLYCDGREGGIDPVCRVGYGYAGPPVYTGETEGECLRQARRDGWTFTREHPRKAYCLSCSKKRRNKRSPS